MGDHSRYVILRDKNAALRKRATGEVLSEAAGGMPRVLAEAAGPQLGGGVGPLLPPGPELDSADLTANEAKDALRQNDVVGVVRAIPIALIAPRDMPADAAATDTWGIKVVRADVSPFTGAGVKVAVLDTGIDASHPAFAGMTLTQQDYTGEGNGDGNGHGTHCAGTIFGRDVDGQRIGVARGVTDAFIGKVLNSRGSGTSEMMFSALKRASEERVQVISMSLGFDFPGLVKYLVEQEDYPPDLATSVALEGFRTNLAMFNALMNMIRQQAVFDGGTVIVAASGNESRREIHPNYEVGASVPAVAEGCIAVGALQQGPAGLTIADFSNTNPDIAAPGVGVLSARAGGGLAALSGTSMACPHVAGVAALWWEAARGGVLPANASTVTLRMLASAALSGLAPGVQVADRGQGLAQAPVAPIS
ncbi:S8 family peptidase [Rhodovulum euryhalinum]|uniref:Subtilisin family serine protease n=1 Tax=Rhodovulum euryhalinum TaxID=35805 RepID=A0A4R2KNF8_9RHOB|nr:S8 family serine peptidase [Rhodovulum euryhalinum]TCO74232.1 subtilisin family serine protease [Rhodovulum euryhalinum]